jgi:nucleotide-binding universal stress UspA family protein
MFQQILVPLDGSELAEQALPIAAHIARHAQGKIVLLECVVPPIEFGPYIGREPPLLVQQAIDTDTEMATDYLKRVVQENNLASLEMESKIEYGWPAHCILTVAEQQQSNLIVISSHGRSGLSRWILGSVAQKVIRHAPIPVLVLRSQQMSEALLDGGHPLRALVPLDGSPTAESVLEPALEMLSMLTAHRSANLHLVHVVDKLSEEQKSHYFMQQAASYLDTIEQRLHDRLAQAGNISVRKSVIPAFDVAGALLDVAETETDTGGAPCDIIMMSTHGRGGIQRWTLGSVTERVLQATNLPLLIVRASQ